MLGFFVPNRVIRSYSVLCVIPPSPFQVSPESPVQKRSREFIEHRRKTGGNLGGRPKTNAKKESLVLRLRKKGKSYRSIKEQKGFALATITRIVKEQVVAV